VRANQLRPAKTKVVTIHVQVKEEGKLLECLLLVFFNCAFSDVAEDEKQQPAQTATAVTFSTGFLTLLLATPFNKAHS
jgi:hypothetical protein